LIYPINGGVHAVAEDDVADSLHLLLLEEYPSITRVILLGSTKGVCSSMARYVLQRTPSMDINQRISGLMAAHAKLTDKAASATAPLARTLIGKKAGNMATLATGPKTREFKIRRPLGTGNVDIARRSPS
jgi:hypothetical protein